MAESFATSKATIKTSNMLLLLLLSPLQLLQLLPLLPLLLQLQLLALASSSPQRCDPTVRGKLFSLFFDVSDCGHVREAADFHKKPNPQL